MKKSKPTIQKKQSSVWRHAFINVVIVVWVDNVV